MTGTRRLVAGRYQLVRALARGGFGQVWQAHDELLEADVVLKEILLPPTADAAERARRLKYAAREARHAARLRHHPCIVPVYDVVIEDNSPWIVMQLVDGGSLKDRLDTGPLPVQGAMKVADALLQALSAAQEADVVHRDIKPGNVMLTLDGRVLLTDFGIAIHPADTRLTHDGGVLGSLPYMAPERLRGHAATPASDLFSLGVTLYQALEGSFPFDTITATLEDPPPPARRAGALTPLLRDLLAKNPTKRPTTTEALARLHALGHGKKERRAERKSGRKWQRSERAESTRQGAAGSRRRDTSQQPPEQRQEQPPRTVFEATWTGDEDLRSVCAYASPGAALIAYLIGIGFAVFAVVGPGAEGASAESVMGGRALCVGVGLFIAALPYWSERSGRTRLRATVQRRTLRLDEEGITVTDPFGSQRVPWTAVDQAGVTSADADVHEQRVLAFHLQLKRPESGSRRVLYRPAGWPTTVSLPEVCQEPGPKSFDWVPVCVLGPMSEPLKVDLRNAVEAYAGASLWVSAEQGW